MGRGAGLNAMRKSKYPHLPRIKLSSFSPGVPNEHVRALRKDRGCPREFQNTDKNTD
jgi:hypothetical protein